MEEKLLPHGHLSNKYLLPSYSVPSTKYLGFIMYEQHQHKQIPVPGRAQGSSQQNSSLYQVDFTSSPSSLHSTDLVSQLWEIVTEMQRNFLFCLLNILLELAHVHILTDDIWNTM